MKAAKGRALPAVKVEITFEPVTPAQRQSWASLWARLLANPTAMGDTSRQRD